METWKWLALAVVAGLLAAWVVLTPSVEDVATAPGDSPSVTKVVEAFSEEEVTFSHGEITLAGTLTLPTEGGPHPAVILISGSGPQNRDSEIPELVPGYQPFRWIAEHLSAQGVAVLRYDDRGFAQSTGEFATATTVDFSYDAEAALDYLLSRDDIDPTSIGLLGHSEGALSVALLAARRDEVALAISLAGTSVSGYEILIRQVELIWLSEGMPADEAQAAAEQQREVLDLAIEQAWEDLERILVEISLAQIAALPEEQQEALGDAQEVAQSLAAQQLPTFQSDWYQSFLTYDPVDDWARVTVPVLAIFGGQDVQVDADQNRAALAAATARAGNLDVTIVTFPEANHLFLPAATGAFSEYPMLPMEFVPRLLPMLTGWILERFGKE
jgi:uncharacterized protein